MPNFDGDDFSNNLFSDLAPLLTLFGEQVTKQFLGMSMGWADNILLSMGPLGIITIVVSAIRVGGDKRLKALVGRARENISVAEQELLSSTSDDVCEMWNGNQIVRLIGGSKEVETYIIQRNGEAYNIPIAFDKKLLVDSPEYIHFDSPFQDTPRYPVEDLALLAQRAPNLTLNVDGARISAWELWSWAALGILLQLFALAFPALVTYRWKWSKEDSSVEFYGYPCFFAGTVCLILGVMMCGYIIESVTEETELYVTRHSYDILDKPMVVTLQSGQAVGDQSFPRCAIVHSNDVVKFSRRSDMDFRALTYCFTILSMIGYIVQFIGFRALHWSATVLQLGVTLIMTGIRAWVRRGLAADPKVFPVSDSYESVWVPLVLTGENNHDTHPSFELAAIPFLDLTSNLAGIGWASTRRKLDCDCIAISSQASVSIHLQCSLQQKGPPHTEGLPSPKPIGLPTPKPIGLPTPKPTGLDIFHKARTGFPGTTTYDEDSKVSNSLKKLIEKTMDYCSQSSEVTWKSLGIVPVTMGENGVSTDADYLASSDLIWSFSVVAGQITRSGMCDTSTQPIQFRLRRPSKPSHNPTDASVRGLLDWELLDAEYLASLLSLSVWAEHHPKMVAGTENQFIERIVGHSMHISDGSVDPHSILNAKMDRLAKWLGITTYSLFPFQLEDSGCGEVIGPWLWDSRSSLGLFLSSSFTREEKPVGLAESSPTTVELVLQLEKPPASVVVAFAGELFSIFMLSIASEVQELLGPTESSRVGEEGKVLYENAVLKHIAGLVVEAGLAEDIQDAYVLIIPAFLHFDLLRDPVDEPAD